MHCKNIPYKIYIDHVDSREWRVTSSTSSHDHDLAVSLPLVSGKHAN